MITITLLKQAGFFSKMDKLKDMASRTGIRKVSVAPSLPYLDIGQEKLHLILDTGASILEDRFDFEDQVTEMYSSHFQVCFFPLAGIQKTIAEKDPVTYQLESFQASAIPIEELNENEALEVQWGRQREKSKHALLSEKSQGQSGIASKPVQSIEDSLLERLKKSAEFKKKHELSQEQLDRLVGAQQDKPLDSEKPSEPVLTAFRKRKPIDQEIIVVVDPPVQENGFKSAR